MTYTLLTKTGRVMQFYVAEMAATYQRLYGGVVFTQQVIDNTSDYDTMIPSNEKGTEYVYNL